MFMGTPTEMNGFDKWNSTKGTIPSTTDNGHGIPPTIYTILRQQFPNMELGLTCDWKGVGAVISETVADIADRVRSGKSLKDRERKPTLSKKAKAKAAAEAEAKAKAEAEAAAAEAPAEAAPAEAAPEA